MKMTNTGFSLESLRLIGAALVLQQATRTAANIVPLPGTGRFVVVGTPAEVARLMEVAPAPADNPSTAGAAPIGWVYECVQPGTDGNVWREFFNREKPAEQKGVRNIEPVFAAPALNPSDVPSQWVSIDDNVTPDEGQRCIVLIWPYDNHENKQIEAIADYVGGTFVNHEGEDIHPPSHWMPFPNVARPSAAAQSVEGGGSA